jgi:hypothetical protein
LSGKTKMSQWPHSVILPRASGQDSVGVSQFVATAMLERVYPRHPTPRSVAVTPIDLP